VLGLAGLMRGGGADDAAALEAAARTAAAAAEAAGVASPGRGGDPGLGVCVSLQKRW